MLVFLLIAASITVSAAPAVPPDPEARLAEAQAARGWRDGLVTQAGQTPEEAEARLAGLRRRFPGSEPAAQADADRVTDLLTAKAWEATLAAATNFTATYPEFGSLNGSVLHCVARMCANSKAVPEPVRRAALDALYARLHHDAATLSFTRNALHGLALEPAARYALARLAADTCGKAPSARAFWWFFLEAYSRTAPPMEAAREVQDFLAAYPDESAETVAARTLALQWRVKAGEAAAVGELKALVEQAARQQAAARLAADRLEQAVKDRQWEAALQAGEAFREVPASLRETQAWPHFLAALDRQASPDLQTRAFRLAFDILPAGQTLEEVFSLLVRGSLFSRPEGLEMAASAIRCGAQDRFRDSQRIRLLLNRMRQANLPTATVIAVLRDLTEAARKVDVPDTEVVCLRQLGGSLWDSDRAAASAVLERGARVCPESLASAECAWLQAFLTSADPLVPGPQPRPARDLSSGAERPALALPPVPPRPAGVVASNGVFRLRALDTKANLLWHQAATVNGGTETAAALTDGNPGTAWRSPALPAEVIAPLREISSVTRIVVRLASPCRLFVALLASDGRVVRRYERAWTLWEQHQAPSLWASGDVTLDLQPVPDVAYVRLEFPDTATDSVGVREVEVYAPAFPVEAVQLTEPSPLGIGTEQLKVTWAAVQPERTVTWDFHTESARPYPVMRWSTPWKHPARQARLRSLGDETGLEFYGSRPVLTLKKKGRLAWGIDGAWTGTVERTVDADVEVPLVPALPEGRHVLAMKASALPAAPDHYGADELESMGLKTEGLSRVDVRIRFRQGRDAWTQWTPLDKPEGSVVTVPPEAVRARPPACQVGFFYDTRAVQALDGAAVSNLVVTALPSGVSAAVSRATDGEAGPGRGGRPEGLFAEDVAAVAGLVGGRGVVVAYPKRGHVREYEAARQLAERAGVYLVSDDIGLNLYPGLVVSVGRPAVHRYARQLLGMRMIWNDPDYLNDADGVVGLVPGMDGRPAYCFATGETLNAVEAAVRRLVARLAAPRPGLRPFRLFASDELEMVYAWQLRPERAAPEAFNLRLGRNDRRSVQFGVAGERQAEAVVRVSELRGPNGATLPPPLVRPVGFYEWVPFFGDLRLPNLLLEEPLFTLPPHTSRGVWVTVVTPEEAVSGRYEATVTVSGGGHEQSVPLHVTVEPVALPDAGPIAFYSFAAVPYWFHDGTAACSNAFRALARDEAAQGVTHVQPRFNVTFTPAGPLTNGPAFTTDFGPLDRQLDVFEEEYRRAGRPLPTFLCQMLPLHQVAKDAWPEDPLAVRRAARLLAEQCTAYLKRTGRADRFIVKVADEPRDIGQWADMARPYREGGLRTMTCHNASYTNIEAAVGIMDPWCPNYQHDLFRPFFGERRKAGDAFWWYCCGVPVTRLTGPAIDNLPFYWLTAKWQLDGAMNYAAMHANMYSSMPVPFRYEHGMDHRIVFRADGSLLETTRRELEGDGIRDCKLVSVIRAQLAALRRAGRAAEADAGEARLAALLNAVVPYKYGYATEPAAWHSARDGLYEMATGTRLTR